MAARGAEAPWLTGEDSGISYAPMRVVCVDTSAAAGCTVGSRGRGGQTAHEGGGRPVSRRLRASCAWTTPTRCTRAISAVVPYCQWRGSWADTEAGDNGSPCCMLTPCGCWPRRITRRRSSRRFSWPFAGAALASRAVWRAARPRTHCQFWLPPALLQAVPDTREKPTVYWLCTTHHGQLTDAEIVALLGRRGRGGTAAC